MESTLFATHIAQLQFLHCIRLSIKENLFCYPKVEDLTKLSSLQVY